jgi:hypothetical protein
MSCNFLFICGAVGSGNTFMFDCLRQDPNLYSIQEAALGLTLSKLRFSNDVLFGHCPHSETAFVDFMQALRGDRKTLILKTPSNIRHAKIIKETLPQTKFLISIREPHAALASGISRGREDLGMLAEIWRSDYEYLSDLDQTDFMVVDFGQFVTCPLKTFDAINDEIIPISAESKTYALEHALPERADENWWRRDIGKDLQSQIASQVREYGLTKIYRGLYRQ